jgi:hypothetical protein
MEVEVIDTLPFSDGFVVKRGPKLATKMYGNVHVQVVVCTLIPTTDIT